MAEEVNQEQSNSGDLERPTRPRPSLERLEDLPRQGPEDGDQRMAERICHELAAVFQVKNHEVALLWIENGMLKFLYPASLRGAGSIPLSSPAVVTHTVASRKAERFNSFPQVKHLRVFEVARSSGPEDNQDFRVIQKLMSAPVLSEDNSVLGVIQISRKGCDPSSAGPDFTDTDLERLEATARNCQQVDDGRRNSGRPLN